MQTLLAVVDGTERTDHPLRAAAERAEREGAGLVVLNVTPESTYRGRQDAIAGVPGVAREGYGYTVEQAETAARRSAERTARHVVGDREVVWSPVGAVGTPAAVVLAVAADFDCGEIVIAETKPRWFGLRGGTDRKLAKRFAGTVTRVPAPAVGRSEPVQPVPEA